MRNPVAFLLLTFDAIFGCSFNIGAMRMLYRDSYDAGTNRFFSGRRTNRVAIDRRPGRGRKTPINRKIMPSFSGSRRLRAQECQRCNC